MIIIDLGKECFSSLKSHKWRTILSMLGIAIGIGGISAITILTDSIGSTIENEITMFGVNNVAIYQHYNLENQFNKSNSPSIIYSDINKIKALNLPITYVTPLIKKYFKASHQFKSIDSTVYFTTPSFEHISFETLSSGRFISSYDEEYGRAVCVIDKTIKDQLFFGEQAIGKKINVNERLFTIVGVMNAKVRTLMNWIETKEAKPSRIIIPISNQLNRMQIKYIPRLVLTVDNRNDIIRVVNQTISLLESQHPGIKYKYSSKTREINSFNSIMFHLRWLFYIITAITLIVGGIGVTNVMVISVLERTKEIGIRKVCGAKYSEIFLQFLSESVLICFISGICGALLGVSISILILSLNHISFVIPILKVFVIFSVTVLTGVLSGFFPALKASRLSIISAIKQE